MSVALAGVSFVVVTVVIWAGYVGVRASMAGPRWARRHLKRVTPLLLVLAAVGGLVAIWLDPVWVGLSLGYVGLVTYWVGRRVLSILDTAERHGDLEPLPASRRAAILRRVSRGLVVAGLALVGLGVGDVLWRGWPGALDLAVGGALLVPGLILRWKADRLQPPERSTA